MEFSLDEFEKTVSFHKDRLINVMELGGYHGETLIHLGLKKMLTRMELDYELFRSEEYDLLLRIFSPAINKYLDKLLNTTSLSKLGFYVSKWRIPTSFDEDSVILIAGGGNINDICRYGVYLLELVIHQNPNATIIVAPQSYYFQETKFPSIFKGFRGQAYLFCREKYSYSHLNKMKFPDNVEVKLSHDTAFYLSKNDFPEGKPSHDLLCFRTDKESVMDEETKKVVMAMAENPLEGDICIKAKSFEEFTSTIADSKKVFTDRLHVGILSAILGKTVFLFPSSYWKNKGVYEHTLSEYDNVTFIELPLSRRNL